MKISREEFKKIYYNHRDKEVARIIGVKCVKTVRRYAAALNLQLKGSGYMYTQDKRKQKKVIFYD